MLLPHELLESAGPPLAGKYLSHGVADFIRE